jgi:hypothetical protein
MATKFMSTSSDQGFYARQHRQSKSHPRYRKVASFERINKAIVQCPGLGMVRGSNARDSDQLVRGYSGQQMYGWGWVDQAPERRLVDQKTAALTGTTGILLSY